MESIKDYFKEFNEIFHSISLDSIEKFASLLEEAYFKDKNIFIIGNGGSASIASHFACDLGKGTINNFFSNKNKRFKVNSLSENIPLISAYGNDLGYENIFSEQLKNLMNPGDILVAVSSSGNSPNIIKAVKTAKEGKLFVIGLSGFKGGMLKELADLSIHIPKEHYGCVEDLHMLILHSVAYFLKEKFKKENLL